jgi:lipoprotein-anchoring transpeptidase ErfK/SrfK
MRVVSMFRPLVALVALSGVVQTASAQDRMDWMPWNQPGYVAPSSARPALLGSVPLQPPLVNEHDRAPALLDGGARPPIDSIPPERIAFKSIYASGSVVIDTSGRRLYLVQSPQEALVYPISVGREGFTWTGTERISRVADWPDWHPPAEMRERDPRLPEKMTGGIRNPLGAKALYLGNTLYRIHGTDNERTIGRATSSGCFRMTNGHVTDLAKRIGVGTTVVVLDQLPQHVAGLDSTQATLPPRSQ